MNQPCLPFETAIENALESLSETLETSLGDTVEIDKEDGVLTAKIAGHGTYLFNRHLPLQQLWLSSPLSGAWHFARDKQGKWLATRGQKETLAEILRREIAVEIDI